ncbi:MAG: restriction endonuclease subunit S [Caulobacter sp.]|nr:restriction endonuclease subunit S [Caulobacter sp.]
MNAKRLLALFDRVSEAPDAVAKLRRFVLDLAVRGKLVDQDPADEPAEDLLRRIQDEKTRRIAAGEYRKDKAANSDPDDPPFALPSSWRWSRLSEIGFLNPRVSAPSDTEAGFVPMPLVAAEHGVANRHEPRPWGQISSGYTHFAEGDVGLAKITPCFENGKSTVFRGLPNGIGAGTTELHIVRPVLVDPDFILLLLKSAHFIESGIPRMTGTAGQKRVPSDYFANSPFPLPPLAEQRRIVARVDGLMTLCDQLEAARADREHRRDRLTSATMANVGRSTSSMSSADQRFVIDTLPALTGRVRQLEHARRAIQDLAVRGRLVEQNAEDESSQVLLRRATEAKLVACADEGIRSRQPIARRNRDDLWFDFPESWTLPAFDDVFVIASGVTKGQKVASVEAVDAPYLRVANVQRGRLDLAVIKTITVRRADVERYALRVGDVLMTEGGDWDKLGRAAVWRGEVAGCIHQNHVFRVRAPTADILPEWVTTYVNSPLGRAFFADASKQTTNLASINMTQLRGCPIPLPPLAEQRRIVARVDELITLCDQLEASLAAADTANARLLDAILHEALNGPLQAEAA